MAISPQVLPGNGKEGVQVFTPTTVTIVAPAGTLDTTSVTVVRVASATDYTINGAGSTGTMPAGASTGIHKSVTSMDFPNGATVEVM